MRPRLTPWYAFGIGWQRTLRHPYLDAPAAAWGQLAERIPGWRWPSVASHSTQMQDLWLEVGSPIGNLPSPRYVIDPDHWAWEGWLLRMLAPDRTAGDIVQICPPRSALPLWTVYLDTQWGLFSGVGTGQGDTLGRACIAAAAALGRWPGGDS